jgi:isopropylmalate/homocitrate/citramalate synthase
MTAARNIGIVEVGPRDGLQNEAAAVPTAVKVEFIRRAVDAGIRRIEVASFVNPKRVPQMADAEAVMQALPRRAGVRYIGLVLNRAGFDRCLQPAQPGRHQRGIDAHLARDLGGRPGRRRPGTGDDLGGFRLPIRG